MITNYCILWEYDKPIPANLFTGYSPNVWQYKIAPGTVTITDDYSVTGYYEDNNPTIYNIKSFSVMGTQYSSVSSIALCESTKQSFYFNYNTQMIYVHYEDDGSPYSFDDISIGAVVGYSKGVISDNIPYFNNIYYEPRIDKVFNIKKNKDRLFFGVLKYTTGSVRCFNDDGHFDDWRDRNLFAQASRILIGGADDTYANYNLAFTGLIEDDSRSFTDFNVKLVDSRKGLTQPIAINLLNQTDYPYLEEGNIDKPKPVKYGQQKNSPCICLNETQTTSNYTFLLCDTEFNAVSSLTAVYMDGVAVTVTSSDLTAGTFVLNTGTVSGLADNLTSITADFVATSISNGVDIIKNLMLNYDNKTYNSTFWDTTEVNLAQTTARSTSVSVDDDKKLSEVIQQICIDIDGVFFSKDTGVYTIRLYDSNRTISKIIYGDEWVSDPDIENNGSEFLSSVIIKYDHDIANDEYLQYENTLYRDEVFDIYRTYKTTTIETNLTSLADAQEKSESIMSISKLVGDIVTRSIPYTSDIEIMDFVVASPRTRLTQNPDYGIYEIIGIEKNLDKFELKLTMRYIRDYTMPIDKIYSARITSDNDIRMTSDGYSRITRE